LKRLGCFFNNVQSKLGFLLIPFSGIKENEAFL
jgi:hypothetical protein